MRFMFNLHTRRGQCGEWDHKNSDPREIQWPKQDAHCSQGHSWLPIMYCVVDFCSFGRLNWLYAFIFPIDNALVCSKFKLIMNDRPLSSHSGIIDEWMLANTNNESSTNTNQNVLDIGTSAHCGIKQDILKVTTAGSQLPGLGVIQVVVALIWEKLIHINYLKIFL